MMMKKNMEKGTGIEDTVDRSKWNKEHPDHEELLRLFEFHSAKCRAARQKVETPRDKNSAKHRFLLSLGAVKSLCPFFTD